MPVSTFRMGLRMSALLSKLLGQEYGALDYPSQILCGIVAHEQFAMFGKLALR
jgi:hypothetical protein